MNGHHCLPRHLGSPRCQDRGPAPAPRCLSQPGRASQDRVLWLPGSPTSFPAAGCAPRAHLPRGLSEAAPQDSEAGKTERFSRLLDPEPQTPTLGPGVGAAAGLTICARASPSTWRRVRRLRRSAAAAMAGGEFAGGRARGSTRAQTGRGSGRRQRWLLSDAAGRPPEYAAGRGGAGARGDCHLRGPEGEGRRPPPSSAPLRPAASAHPLPSPLAS